MYLIQISPIQIRLINYNYYILNNKCHKKCNQIIFQIKVRFLVFNDSKLLSNNGLILPDIPDIKTKLIYVLIIYIIYIYYILLY